MKAMIHQPGGFPPWLAPSFTPTYSSAAMLSIIKINYLNSLSFSRKKSDLAGQQAAKKTPG
jgi:hypothetical protein